MHKQIKFIYALLIIAIIGGGVALVLEDKINQKNENTENSYYPLKINKKVINKIEFTGIIGNYQGSKPRSLVFQDGKFFGTTQNGGASDLGTIFEWDPNIN